MTLLEAAANNLPVCASNIGPFPELIEDGKTGILLRNMESNRVAQAISDVYHDSQKLNEMASAAQQYLKPNLSEDLAYQNILAAYEFAQSNTRLARLEA